MKGKLGLPRIAMTCGDSPKIHTLHKLSADTCSGAAQVSMTWAALVKFKLHACAEWCVY